MASGGGRALHPIVGASTRFYSNRLIVLVAVFAVLAMLGVSAVVLGTLRNSRAQALDAAERASRNLTLAVTGTVSRTVQSVDVLLLSTATQLTDGGSAQGGAALDGQFRRLLAFMPHVRQLTWFAADGRVLADSGDRLASARMDMAAFFSGAVDARQAMSIGTLQPGRGFGPALGEQVHHYIPFYRLVAASDGGAPSVLVAAVNPLYFNEIFAHVDLSGSTRLRLWRYDGTLLAGHADDRDYSAGGHAQAPLFARYLKGAEFGTFSARDEDGHLRITGYRTTLNWPLVVSIGLDRDDVLDHWRQSALPLIWPVGALMVGLLGMAVFLTWALISRARAEAMLVLSERVLETMSNGVAISDATVPDLPLIYVNPAFEAMTGYGAAEVLGRNPRFLHSSDDDQPGLTGIRTALQAGRSVDAVVRNYRADGSAYWNEMTISAVHSSSGKLTHFVGIQRDITEQEQNRVHLADAYARIERYSAELERFSFILAHHLQEPARHIALYSQLVSRTMADRTADPELMANLAFLTQAGGRLKELLRDVQLYLAVDRLAQAGGSANTEAILDKEWISRSRRLENADMASGQLPRVQVPARRLADLFAIMIENSIRFRESSRPLRVRVSAETGPPGQWTFRFADNGMGIAPEFLEKVFGVFERLHGREHFPGNGVGLAIARKLVETLGGRIWAESDGKTGTTLVFTLPATTE